MNKQNVVHTHNEILFNLKEKKILVHTAPRKNFEGIYYAKDEAEKDSLV